MKTFKKILIGVVILIILSVLAVIIYIKSFEKDDYTTMESKVQLTAAELYSEFVKDDLSAAKKFNGEVISVEGIVDTVEIADDRRIVVMYLNEGLFGPEGIRAELHENETDKLEKGDNIILKGYCTGFTGNDVLIEYATVVEKSN
ncbi:MAG TPA: hypothetical protein PKW37_02685 [Salinivirgaceae bacterium]|nr:hypothetical protein [Salinivirgaceae bacterium]